MGGDSGGEGSRVLMTGGLTCFSKDLGLYPTNNGNAGCWH